MTFEDLDIDKQTKNALSDLGYITPTPIQSSVFPIALSGKDVVGIAQTGTGKTIAYLLPILKQLKFSDQRQPRILIVVPTRELVLQVVEEIEKITKYKSVRVYGIYGGANINTQKQKVYDGTDILVATPGRLVDLTLTGVLRMASIQKLVIDEVDEMLALGFRPQMITIMESLPEKRQNLMFSATLTEDVEELIKSYFYDPKFVEVGVHGTPLDKIVQHCYHVPNFNTKLNLVSYLLSLTDVYIKVLVFASSKRVVDVIDKFLEKQFPNNIAVIHSNKSQNQRFNGLKRFEEGTDRILIATDIAARGLDISNVTHVINFDTPEIPGNYIHRIGRTGRADKAGISITFATELEIPFINEIEKLMNKKIPVDQFPDEVEISEILTLEEKPNLGDKNYLKIATIKDSKGAFHEKIDKNKKVNLGGPHRNKEKKPKSAKWR